MSARNWPGEATLARLAMTVALALLIGASGCTVPLPGTGGALPGGPATIYPPGAEVPDLSGLPSSMTREQRSTAARTVTETWSPQRTGDLKADATALLAVIAKTPGFADAGTSSDGSVWARYQDGRPLVWVLTKDEDPKAQSPMPTPAPSAVGVPRLRGLGGLPRSETAVVLNWRNMAEIVTSTITPWLRDANYTVSPATNRVRDLMTKIKDVGVLHLATHGGAKVDASGNTRYILTTDDLWDGSNMSAEENANYDEYAQMMQEGLLVPTIIPDNIITHNFGDLYVWSITSSFVQKYWTFSQDALIYFTACAYFETVESAEFNLAVKAAAADRNPTVIGWDHPVGVFYAEWIAMKYFARLLGENSIDQEKIPRRPFSYQDVYKWMVDSGEVHDIPIRHATLLLFGEGQLVPSILKSAVIHPGKKSSVPHAGERYLEIAGSFGPDPGPENRSVTVGETKLEVYPDGWKETSIQAKLPQDSASPGSYGDVVVEVRGHPSNPAPLTQWTGYVSQAQVLKDTHSSGKAHIFCPVRLTADLHFFRGAPRTDPMTIFSTEVETTGPCTYRIWGSWSTSGERHDLSGSGKFHPDDNIVGGFQSFTRNIPKLNADNHGDQPITVGTTLTWVSDKTTGTHTITSSSGATRRIPIHADFSALGTYWNDRSFKLDSNYAAPTRVRDCNMENMFESCAETWNLTPKAPIPTKDTQA